MELASFSFSAFRPNSAGLLKTLPPSSVAGKHKKFMISSILETSNLSASLLAQKFVFILKYKISSVFKDFSFGLLLSVAIFSLPFLVVYSTSLNIDSHYQ